MVFVHINARGVKLGVAKLTAGDCEIESTNSARFLGVIIDYRLSFKPYVKHVVRQCTLKSNVIKFLCGTKWGAHPLTLLILYMSFVCSVMDYGSFVNFLKTSSFAENLEKV